MMGSCRHAMMERRPTIFFANKREYLVHRVIRLGENPNIRGIKDKENKATIMTILLMVKSRVEPHVFRTQLLHHRGEGNTALELAHKHKHIEAEVGIAKQLLYEFPGDSAQTGKVAEQCLRDHIEEGNIEALVALTSVWDNWYDSRGESLLRLVLMMNDTSCLILLRRLAFDGMGLIDLQKVLEVFIPIHPGRSTNLDLVREGISMWRQAHLSLDEVFALALFSDEVLLQELLHFEISVLLLDLAYAYFIEMLGPGTYREINDWIFEALRPNEQLNQLEVRVLDKQLLHRIVDEQLLHRIVHFLRAKGCLEGSGRLYHIFQSAAQSPSEFRKALGYFELSKNRQSVERSKSSDKYGVPVLDLPSSLEMTARASMLYEYLCHTKLYWATHDHLEVLWGVQCFLHAGITLLHNFWNSNVSFLKTLGTGLPTPVFWLALEYALREGMTQVMLQKAFEVSVLSSNPVGNQFLLIGHMTDDTLRTLALKPLYKVVTRHLVVRENQFFHFLKSRMHEVCTDTTWTWTSRWQQHLEKRLRMDLDPGITGIDLPKFIKLARLKPSIGEK